MIVLDTHVLIWLLQDDAQLGMNARAIILEAAAESRVLIPAICAWEVALLVRRGKIRLPVDVVEWMRNAVDRTGLRLASLDPEVAVDSVTMVWHHRDPADRMIVATTRRWSATLITADRAILDFARDGHVQVIDARR